MGFQLGIADGLPDEFPSRRVVFPHTVDFPHLLDDLEEPGASGNALRLERGRDSEAYRSCGAAFIGNNEVGIQRVKAARHQPPQGL